MTILTIYRDWDQKIRVGSFERVHEPLRLGQLSGNRFSVALRFIPTAITTEQIALSKFENMNNHNPLDVENLKTNGFINYFGMQRFGTYNVRTHEIGKENLHQNWIKVIHLILEQHPDGDDYQRDRKKLMIKYVFEDGNIEEAIKLLERRDVR